MSPSFFARLFVLESHPMPRPTPFALSRRSRSLPERLPLPSLPVILSPVLGFSLPLPSPPPTCVPFPSRPRLFLPITPLLRSFLFFLAISNTHTLPSLSSPWRTRKKSSSTTRRRRPPRRKPRETRQMPRRDTSAYTPRDSATSSSSRSCCAPSETAGSNTLQKVCRLLSYQQQDVRTGGVDGLVHVSTCFFFLLFAQVYSSSGGTTTNDLLCVSQLGQLIPCLHGSWRVSVTQSLRTGKQQQTPTLPFTNKYVC